MSSASPHRGHLQDWTVVLNGEHWLPVNSQQLAQHSKYFHDRLVAGAGRWQESGCLIAPQQRRIAVNYEDADSLRFLLKFVNDYSQQTEGQWPVGARELPGLVLVATHFQVPKLLDFLFAATLQQVGSGNWWQYWRTSASSKVLASVVQSIIAENFLTAAEEDGFLKLSPDELLGFLRHQHLNVDSELELVACIDRWVSHRPAERLRCTWGLVSSLRLGLLSNEQLRQLAASRCVAAAGCERLLLSLDFASAQLGPGLSHVRAPRAPHEVIFLCGGWEGLQNDPNFGPSDAVQVYNYQDSSWIRYSSRVAQAPALSCGHAYSGCVLLHFDIFIVGGYVQGRGDSPFQGPTASVKAYNLRSHTWRERAAMHHARNYVGCAVLCGKIYAIGGHNGRLRLSSAECYCPARNRWQLIAPLLQVRSDAGCAALGDSVYVCGGFNGHQFFSSVERYDPGVDQWTLVSAMASIRSGVSLCACGGFLYALGGNNGASRLATVERYDPEANQWTPMPPMLTQRSNFSACVLRSRIYAIGGWSDQTNSTVSVVERWRPGLTNAWETDAELHMPASANCCCCVAGLHRAECLVPGVAAASDNLEAVD